MVWNPQVEDLAERLLCDFWKSSAGKLLRAAYDAGQRDFGENYVQELVAKAPQMPDVSDSSRVDDFDTEQQWTTRWYARTPTDVIDEIEHYYKTYGATNFPFQDLTAILKRNWVVEFCEEVEARGLDITWQLPAGPRSEGTQRGS